MKEEINLLPPAAAHERMRAMYNRRVVRLYNTVFVGLLLVLTSYASVYGQSYYARQQLSISSGVAGADDEVVQQIADANLLLRVVGEEVKKKTHWLPFLAEVLGEMPAEMRVESIELDRFAAPNPTGSDIPVIKRSLVLKGTSATRTAVVEFERTLEDLTWVESVEAPLQNLANGNNISYQFTIFPKQEEL